MYCRYADSEIYCRRLIEAQVTRGILIHLLQFVGLVVVGTLLFRSFSRGIWLSVSKLARGLHHEMAQNMAQNTPALGFLERLCSMTNSHQVKKMREPLSQLLTEMRTAGQTPYLPSLSKSHGRRSQRKQKLISVLAAHTDFVLEIIDLADDRYNASVRAQRLLEANEEELKQSTAKYDALLVLSEQLRAQLAAKIQELEKNGRETKAIDNTRQQLQTALQKKTVDYDEVCGRISTSREALETSRAEKRGLRNSLEEKTKGYDAVVQQLQNANTKCSGLEATLTTVQGDLQAATDRCGRLERELKAANDRWDAFSQGPSGIDGMFTIGGSLAVSTRSHSSQMPSTHLFPTPSTANCTACLSPFNLLPLRLLLRRLP